MDTLDCLLINPPFVFPNGFYSGQRALDPPLGILALASQVRDSGYSVDLLDCNVEFHDTDGEFETYFRKNYSNLYDKVRVIGLTTTTPTINAAFRIARMCKEIFPEAVVVFGGAHASYVPDEALDKPFIDCVCIGEGEDTLKELLDGKPFAEIGGLAYKESEAGFAVVRKNSPRQRIRNLDELPRPAYDLIDMKIYRPIIGNFKRLPAMMMITSRGCPWSCSFCRRPVGKTWTYRSAQSLYREMKFLSENYGVKDIAFMDDVFTVNRQRVYDLCQLLIDNPIDVRWKCFARVDIVSAEMLKKMGEAGCWGIMYGVENFEQSILDSISKGLEVNQIFSAVRWAKDAGLEIRVCMMVGNIGDTKEIIDNNIKLIKKLNPDTLSVAILTPFPGHGIYNQILDQDRILTYDWDLYFGSTPIVKLDTLSPQDVYRLFRKMTFSFYFRPAYIFSRLTKIKSFTELWYNFKGFLGLLGFFLDGFRSILLPFRSRKPVTAMMKDKITRRIDVPKLRLLTGTPTPETGIS